ncbi:hypothetical protein HHL28_13565 [Aerophototrophica crusticola]|uniref:Uncharacterized protein n=1 Tax=Aerophototrophica crusticola TaxID=1709002 RepID=A0A858R997_9PROT|nr:hypothetical protein HHL28_13565 [Rhodospirillaceae bacterium B3]
MSMPESPTAAPCAPCAPADADGPLFDDKSRDALHILPMAMLPVSTPGLRRSKLIKNARLETVVEVFHDRQTGSGQVSAEHLGSLFPTHTKELRVDMVQIAKLTRINSFDVYTLRKELRRLGIAVNNADHLKLSEGKRGELTGYMKDFTRPLLQQVYGGEERQVSDVSEILAMLANPDREEALRNLRLLSEKLKVKLQDIPDFLEEYGDVFLSLAYFRNCLDGLVPEVQRFMKWAMDAKESDLVARDRQMVKMLADVQSKLTSITTSITGRFEAFDRRSKDFWNDISADSFRAVRHDIESHHVTIGGVLCGLAVKMALWKQRFPQGGGGPQKRVEFIRSEILPGLDHIDSIEKKASGR